jgi:hypothetical protein
VLRVCAGRRHGASIAKKAAVYTRAQKKEILACIY